MVYDPHKMIEGVGGARAELAGIKQVGPDAFLFADARLANRISEEWNLRHPEPQHRFLIHFYEGDPDNREILQRFVTRWEWPMVKEGRMALHDWTVHSMINLAGNDFLQHVHRQMGFMEDFLIFIESHPDRFPKLNDPANQVEFKKQTIDAYTSYLDNALGAANLVSLPNAWIFKNLRHQVEKSPRQLFEWLSESSTRGGGDGFQETNREWKLAREDFLARRSPDPSPTYKMTRKNILKGIKAKTGAAGR